MLGFQLPRGGDPGQLDVDGSGQERSANSHFYFRTQEPPTLRPYQVDIVEQVKHLEHPLIPLPTGAGKTVVASAIIEEPLGLAAVRRRSGVSR